MKFLRKGVEWFRRSEKIYGRLNIAVGLMARITRVFMIISLEVILSCWTWELSIELLSLLTCQNFRSLHPQFLDEFGDLSEESHFVLEMAISECE